jgi:K319-like protein/lamin tail-like protein/type IX secretion system substrate protein
MKRNLLIIMLLVAGVAAYGQLFINEIDYDQPGTDAAEYVELAGPAGTYNNVVIDLVNGNDGASYKTISLGNITLANESGGYGFYVVGVAAVTNVDFTVTPETNLIQNGAPDGVQLSVGGTIVDAVAYEGTLNDLSGNPMEVASVDYNDKWVGAADTSLSRIGLDNSPWVATANTPGAINTGQVLAAGTNYPPTANAGSDQLVFVDVTVTLDGSGSSDPNDNIASYLWTQISGTTVTLANAAAVTTTFTAPSVDADLEFILTVTDDAAAASTDTVAIAVRAPQDSKLIISEYIEGDGGNNKAIELYNLDSSAVSLTGYSVKLASNGEGWGTEEVLSGTLGANEVYVIANSSSVQSILDIADITSAVTYFNGQDAVGLFLNGVLVDVIGVPTEVIATGGGWDVAGVTNATTNHTLLRKGTIEAANANWASSAGTNTDNSEWIVMDANYFSDLGSHSSGPVAYTISNASVTTPFPQAGSEISLTVDITPGEGVSAPTTVKIFYGSGGTQANQADMWLESGVTYAGNIPALSSGNIVLDYYISAIGAETINSGLYSMTVAGALTNISDIHSNILTYDGMTKTIEGVITIGAGILRDDRTSAYIQDGSGRGLNLYTGALLTDLTRGTKIKLVGTVTAYYTTVEMVDFEYTVVSTGQSLPAANSVTVAGANSAVHEGTLTTVTGTLAEVQNFTTSKNMILTTGTDSAVIKIWPTTGIDPSTYTVGTDYAITGVGSQYMSEYQLLVGYASDINGNVAICDDCAPETFALDKAYPNPFNPSTTIQFSIVDASDFEISVYNIAGQKMSVLANGYAQPGVYKQVWNAADFTSGVYFIRLTAGANVATQKVVLIK